MKKLLFILAITFSLLSCVDGYVDAEIYDNMVVEQIKLVSTDTSGVSHYKVKLATHQGGAYYYTTYRHEAGDTLVSIFEFTDHREQLLKNEKAVSDSIKNELKMVTKKNIELTLYNEMLSKVAFDKMEEEYNN